MSADILRAAATRLREAAEAATPGPWECYGDHLVWPSGRGPAANDPIAGISQAHEECATYIALMSPPVALAMADWLDYTARIADEGNDDPELPEGCDCPYCIGIPLAVNLAQAVLGSES